MRYLAAIAALIVFLLAFLGAGFLSALIRASNEPPDPPPPRPVVYVDRNGVQPRFCGTGGEVDLVYLDGSR